MDPMAHTEAAALWGAGARLDAWLSARGGGAAAFSRAEVLRRYHYRAGAWPVLRYRWRLLRVRGCRGWEKGARNR